MDSCKGCIRCSEIKGDRVICRRFRPYDGIAVLDITDRPNAGCSDYRREAPRPSLASRPEPNLKASNDGFNGSLYRKKAMPEDFSQIVDDWMGGKISIEDAAEKCGCCVSTFHKNAREAGCLKYKGCKGD